MKGSAQVRKSSFLTARNSEAAQPLREATRMIGLTVSSGVLPRYREQNYVPPLDVLAARHRARWLMPSFHACRSLPCTAWHQTTDMVLAGAPRDYESIHLMRLPSRSSKLSDTVSTPYEPSCPDMGIPTLVLTALTILRARYGRPWTIMASHVRQRQGAATAGEVLRSTLGLRNVP